MNRHNAIRRIHVRNILELQIYIVLFVNGIIMSIIQTVHIIRAQ